MTKERQLISDLKLVLYTIVYAAKHFSRSTIEATAHDAIESIIKYEKEE